MKNCSVCKIKPATKFRQELVYKCKSCMDPDCERGLPQRKNVYYCDDCVNKTI